MSIYLTLNSLRIQHANAMPAWNLVGAPSITAHLGFGGALAHRYGAKFEGVAILHQGLELEGMMGDYNRFSPNRVRGLPPAKNASESTKGKSLAMSDQPGVSAYYDCSLIIKLNEDAEASMLDDITTGRFEEWFFGSARIAGGVIFKAPKPPQFFESASEAMESLGKRRFWVVDRANLIEERMAGEDQLDAVIRILYPENEKNEATGDEVDEKRDDVELVFSEHKKSFDRNEDVEDDTGVKIRMAGRPWRALSCVGYRTLTEFAQRVGVRKGLPHAFAEPILGLVEYLPARKAGDCPPIFWRFRQPDSRTFVGQSEW